MEIFTPSEKFTSPEEELAFLRAQVAEHQKILNERGTDISKKEIIHETINNYKGVENKDVLHKDLIMKESEQDALVLRLRPESHDSSMEELLGILLAKGIKNALDIVEKMNDPHISDDFHRFLVQYMESVHAIPGLKEKTPLYKSLSMKLFQVLLPEKNTSDNRDFKSLLGTMEQFFAGMQYIGDGRGNKENDHYTIEIAVNNESQQVVFYTAIPNDKTELFEKQLLSIHPNAKIEEMPDDYNIFSEGGYIAGSVASLKENDVFPLKTYDTFEHDPMEVLLNAFNKLKKTGEGACIQYIIRPKDDKIVKTFTDYLEKAKKGDSIKKDDDGIFASVGKDIAGSIGASLFGDMFGGKKEEESKEDKEKERQDRISANTDKIASIGDKLKSTITSANIRIFASAEDATRADSIINDLEAVFHQFTRIQSNNLEFKKIDKKNINEIARDFSYRNFREDEQIFLNLHELVTIVHYPYGISGVEQLKQAKSGGGPAPLEMGHEGIQLGINQYRGVDTPIHMAREDRMRHLYVIGQTGTGKTVLLKNMIAQDIANGDGCCFIDPHGNDIQDVLSYIPKERIDDVIYFDPSYTARPMGLNMLEFDPRYPEQKSMVIDSLMSIFNQLFDMKVGGGAMFEQYFKNSALLVMEDPESDCTILEITRVLADKTFRDMKLAKCKNMIIKQFWVSAEQTTGDQGLANFVGYISSKFDPFISNEFMRPVVLQKKSSFNFRDIMDNKKILLVNLSKGRLGELNANLIGMIIVMKFQMAALSRVDMYGKKVEDFFLYIDEFQNVTTPAISSILSEARKYRLSLTIAHQYISQLPEDIKGAVFGNVGSMAVFRISPEDAEFMEKKYAPTFTASDITKLDNFNSYVNMLVGGIPTKPFNMLSHWSQGPKGNKEIVQSLKDLSYLTYGSPREEVEDEIMSRYKR